MVALVAATVRLYMAGHESQLLWDELFHLLAARSWADGHTLVIANGIYGRAWLFTALIGELYRLFGESVFVARLPSLLAGTGWVVAVFLWTRSVASAPAAWIAAMLFCFAPASLFLSQFIRFYALHGLLFWIVAVNWYAVVCRSIPSTEVAWRIVLLLVSGGIALHLQLTTVIGLLVLGVWSAAEVGRQWLDPELRTTKLRVLIAGGVIAGLVGAGYLAVGGLDHWIDLYRGSAVFVAQQRADNVVAYHQMLVSQFPTLWTLLPLAVLVGMRAMPRPVLFSTTMFLGVVLIHSFAGRREERYIAYAMPYFFVLWGIAIAVVWPQINRVSRMAVTSALGTAANFRTLEKPLGAGLALAAVIFAILSNPATVSAAKRLRSPQEFPTQPTSHWRDASEVLRPWLERAEVLVTTNGTYAQYYFGDYDFEVSRNIVSQTDTAEEFGRDRRTGRLAISEPESVRSVLSCFQTGLFVGHAHQWRHARNGISNEAIEVLVGESTEIVTPKEWRMKVFYWEHPVKPDSGCCVDVRRRLSGV
jgi:hypothetical protein